MQKYVKTISGLSLAKLSFFQHQDLHSHFQSFEAKNWILLGENPRVRRVSQFPGKLYFSFSHLFPAYPQILQGSELWQTNSAYGT